MSDERTQVVKVALLRTGTILLLHNGLFWDLPGGEVNPEEPLDEAAKREVVEETRFRRLRSLWHVVSADTIGPVPGHGYLQVHFWAACVAKSAWVRQLSSEHTDYRWVPVIEAATMLNTQFFADGSGILRKLGLSDNPLGQEHISTRALDLLLEDGTPFSLEKGKYLVRRADSQWRLSNSNRRLIVPPEADAHLIITGKWVPWDYSVAY